jgi:hypothetical protein
MLLPSMTSFSRPCTCESCGREYLVSGTSANPTNETQVAVDFTCACGGVVPAFLPGSVNRDLVRIEPKAK